MTLKDNASRIDILNFLIRKFGFKRYIEIGIEDGNCFSEIHCEFKIGVDPDPKSKATIHKTSDDFFAENKFKFGLIFIDGLHEASQVYQDILNALDCLEEGGIILCHDMLPANEKAQVVPRNQDVWNGDCWKAFVQLRSSRPDLAMATINTDHGLGMIMKGSQTTIANNKKPIKLVWNDFVVNRQYWMNIISVAQFEQFCERLISMKQ